MTHAACSFNHGLNIVDAKTILRDCPIMMLQVRDQSLVEQMSMEMVLDTFLLKESLNRNRILIRHRETPQAPRLPRKDLRRIEREIPYKGKSLAKGNPL